MGTVDIHTLDEQEKEDMVVDLLNVGKNQYPTIALGYATKKSNSRNNDCISLLDKLDR